MAEKEKAECIYEKYVKFRLDENGIAYVSFVGVDKTFDEQKQKTKPCLPLVLMMELGNFFREIVAKDKENAIKEIYLEGFADANIFAAGADIAEFKKILETSKNKNTLYKKALIFSEIGQAALSEIFFCKKKVTAIIHKFALGGGLELAMACRARIADSKAILGLPETTLGLIPGWGGTQWWRLIPKINQEKFTEYMKTGATFNGRRALEIGLIDAIMIDTADDIDTLPSVNTDKIYSKNSALLIKETLTETALFANTEGIKTALAIEAKNFVGAIIHPDATEGITAFLEKRKPNFNN